MKYIIVILAASLLFFPFLGHVHLFDWDEINFAECAREMIVSKDYVRAQIDFMPFWEKPPVFIWMQVLAMKMFGVGEYAARFPNAFMGVLTLVTLYYVGKKVVNQTMAGWWVALYAATWLPHFYFKTGIIDPTFNYFIFLSFFQFHLLLFSGRKNLHALLAGLFLGMAVLTKGPAAALVVGLSFLVYFIINRGMKGFTITHFILIGGSAVIPFLLWMGVAMAQYGFTYGKWFLTEFISYQVRLFSTEDSDHGGPFIYHFIVLLFGCFPASAFLFQYSRNSQPEAANTKDFKRWMWVMFWVVLILFSIVRTKIVHYSSLCYFPLTFLAAFQIYKLAEGQAIVKKTVKIILAITGGLLALLIGLLPVVGLNKNALIPYIADPFAVGNLAANVSWSYAECAWGLGYLIITGIALYLMKKNFRYGIMLLFGVQLVIIQATVIHFTPKIEAYSQNAAIEFYKSFEGKDVYIHTLDYKSYAYLFYARKQPFANPHYYYKGKIDEQWLLTGAIDHPAYFVCKIQNAAHFAAFPNLQKLQEKNGFVFFVRK